MFSGKEVIKRLEELGFQQIRQKGSHIIMKKLAPTGLTIGCVIPLHKELAYGTLRGILNQAGLNLDEFINDKNK
jgi:predicted RNA binding protein YcfA (HicA-like mRNA interferase family)